MPRRPAAELPGLALPAPDPELEALPEPRRPGRRLTLVTMAVTSVLALAMAYSMRGEAMYSLRSGSPNELGNLTTSEPHGGLANTWVHGDALLASQQAIRYSRPLEEDGYRLAPVAGNERIWVQVHVPKDMEGPRFVPPTSFVGRFIPISQAGLRHEGLADAVKEAKAGDIPANAWLLIDGEAPSTTRWSIALVGLFIAFAAFNIWGLVRLLRPVRDQ